MPCGAVGPTCAAAAPAPVLLAGEGQPAAPPAGVGLPAAAPTGEVRPSEGTEERLDSDPALPTRRR